MSKQFQKKRIRMGVIFEVIMTDDFPGVNKTFRLRKNNEQNK